MCPGFAIYAMAHAELLCTCVASVQVQMLVACICRSARAVAWRQCCPRILNHHQYVIGLKDLTLANLSSFSASSASLFLWRCYTLFCVSSDEF